MLAVSTSYRQARDGQAGIDRPRNGHADRLRADREARTRAAFESERLREYLADHDAPCPACGYNLRGNADGACPECGRGVSLGLQTGDALLRRTALLLLLFLWLVFAGSMNTARTWWQIDATAQRTPLRQVMASLPAPVRTLRAAPATGSFLLEELVLTSTGSLAKPGSIQINVVPGTASSYSWSNVTTMQWARLAGWGLLSGLAVTGLVLLWRGRRGRATAGLVRVVMVLAWTGFGSYFAYHGLMFLTELT